MRMKDMMAEAIDRFQGRWLHDIEGERQRQALVTTARFVEEFMPTAEQIPGRTARQAKLNILHAGLDLVAKPGLVVEFGVAGGGTLREIAAKFPGAHGFDSFEGLPEDWRPGFSRGHFTRPAVPDVPGAVLHQGWFDETLPEFLGASSGLFSFVHIDADLYSSTDLIFRAAEDRFVDGTVILFDEYFNYPGWDQHEHKAFEEFVARTGHGFRYVAYNPLHEQVLVVLTS